MRPQMYVRQHEEITEDGDRIFWWLHKGRNGKIVAVSEMFPTRSNAIRAARAFIKSIDPVQVEFSYWTGRYGEMELRTELIR